MKSVVLSTLTMASLLTASLFLTLQPASAADYYYDGNGAYVQRTSVLSDVLNSPVFTGNVYGRGNGPYSAGYHDGYRDGTRYSRNVYRDRGWQSAYPPGHYHGRGKKKGHYKHDRF